MHKNKIIFLCKVTSPVLKKIVKMHKKTYRKDLVLCKSNKIPKIFRKIKKNA